MTRHLTERRAGASNTYGGRHIYIKIQDGTPGRRWKQRPEFESRRCGHGQRARVAAVVAAQSTPQQAQNMPPPRRIVKIARAKHGFPRGSDEANSGPRAPGGLRRARAACPFRPGRAAPAPAPRPGELAYAYTSKKPATPGFSSNLLRD